MHTNLRQSNLINDMSRERRSPENFHPPQDRLESNEVDVNVTENEVDHRHDNQMLFSPRLQKMQAHTGSHVVKGQNLSKTAQIQFGRVSAPEKVALGGRHRRNMSAKSPEQNILSDSQALPEGHGDVVPDENISDDFDFDQDVDKNLPVNTKE